MDLRGLGYPGRVWRAIKLRRLAYRALIYALWMAFDGLIVAAAYWAALWLRFNGYVPATYFGPFPWVIGLVIAVHLAMNLRLGMYWRGWRYAGLHDAVILAVAVGISTALAFLIGGGVLIEFRPLPRAVVPTAGVLVFLLMGLGRFRHRLYQHLMATFSQVPQRRLLIVGAGEAGHSLARELLASPTLGYRPIGFVDDDPGKLGQWVQGLRVLGNRHDLKRLVKQNGVQSIGFAIPSLTGAHRQELLSLCVDTGTQVKVVPGLSDLLQRSTSTDLLRDVRLEDLLGRPRVAFASRTATAPAGQTILITGAAGSIGAELASQLAVESVRRLVLLDVDESRLYDLAADLDSARAGRPCAIEIVVGDVTRLSRLEELFAAYRPAVVYHAAAYKHVPMMERHPAEAIRTNVIGTYNLCLAAQRSGCERLVFISTDKAVAPSSVMGATKRVGERIVEAFGAAGPMVCCAVRFGNVLGSRGSLIPTVMRQIRLGGPITLTHPDMTRFFMTIPEATNLIIEASYQAESGDIFILDMGDPVHIVDLVYKMIRLHGLEPGEDISIQWTGTRPGEKMHESLLRDVETRQPTEHPSIWRVASQHRATMQWHEMQDMVDQLRAALTAAPHDSLVAELFAAAGEPPRGDEPVPLRPAAGPRPVRAPLLPGGERALPQL